MPRPTLRGDSEDSAYHGMATPSASRTTFADDVETDVSTMNTFDAPELSSKPLREVPAPANAAAEMDAPVRIGCEVQEERTPSQGSEEESSPDKARPARRRPAKSKSRANLQVQMEEEMLTWSPMRQYMAKALMSSPYQAAIGFVIVFNIVLMCVEGSIRAKCYPEECEQPEIVTLNRILLLIYLVEVCMKLYVERSRFPENCWNLLDCAVVGLGIFDEFVSLLLKGVKFPAQALWPMLRLLRVARMMRAVKVLKHQEELYVMVRGFLGAMKAMFWGFVMIVLLLLLWGLVMVELVNPINKDLWAEVGREQGPEAVDQECVEWFATVPDSMLFLFQVLVAGDNWSQCINPIIKYQPMMFIPFAAALMSVTLGFMNLILAVVVDRACAVRDEDREQQLKEKHQDQLNALQQWGDMMQELDEDHSGTLTFEELMAGWEMPEVQDALSMLGMDRDDLVEMFELMDKDGSGDVDYKEFVGCFIRAEKQDLRPNIMLTKLQASSLGQQVKVMRETLGKLDKDDGNLRGEIAKLEGVSESMAKHLGSLADADRHSTMSFAMLEQAMAAVAAPQPSAPSPAPALASAAARAPAPLPGADGTTFQEDFKQLLRGIQAQFDALSRSVELNTTMLERNAKAIESVAAEKATGSQTLQGKAATSSRALGQYLDARGPLRAAEMSTD